MHIKRFIARDMKQAIRMVREEQGPDAVILSNQRVPGGIEIIAAVDYDPRLIGDALGAAASPTPPAHDELERRTPARRPGPGFDDAEAAGAADVDTQALLDALRSRAREASSTPARDATPRSAAAPRPADDAPRPSPRRRRPISLADAPADAIIVRSPADAAATTPPPARPAAGERDRDRDRDQDATADAAPNHPRLDAARRRSGVDAAAADRDARPPITAVRYSDIDDEPFTDAWADGDDDAGDDRVALSREALAGADGGGLGNSFFGILAGVTRRGGGTPREGSAGAAAQAPDEATRHGRLIVRSLARVGVDERLVRELADAASDRGRQPLDWPGLARQAHRRLRTLEREVIDTGGIVALVGPTGVGKTTTIAKLAARFALRHGRDGLALVTTDTFRVGAHEQLDTFARILDVPLHTAGDDGELADLLRHLSKNRLVLIDTAGVGQRDVRLAEELALLARSRASLRVLLTLSANTERRTLVDAIGRFGAVKPAGCVLTKVDEAVAPGTALGALIETGLPLAYTCNGQNVPEDLFFARSRRLDLVEHVLRQADREGRDGIELDEVRESA